MVYANLLGISRCESRDGNQSILAQQYAPHRAAGTPRFYRLLRAWPSTGYFALHAHDRCIAGLTSFGHHIATRAEHRASPSTTRRAEHPLPFCPTLYLPALAGLAGWAGCGVFNSCSTAAGTLLLLMCFSSVTVCQICSSLSRSFQAGIAVMRTPCLMM
jgi:hypothetical protein